MKNSIWFFLIVAFLGTAAVVEAQQHKKIWRLGVFHVGLDHVPGSFQRLKEGLKARGYEEGLNIELDWRNLPDDEALAKRQRSSFIAKWTSLSPSRTRRFEPSRLRLLKFRLFFFTRPTRWPMVT